MKAYRYLPAYLLSAGVLIMAPACASGGYYGQRPSYSYNDERIAYQNGYDRGVRNGDREARDRQRYDPIRPKRYREGDHDYDSRYGSRDEYKREYRAAFQQGYEAGYRDARR